MRCPRLTRWVCRGRLGGFSGRVASNLVGEDHGRMSSGDHRFHRADYLRVSVSQPWAESLGFRLVGGMRHLGLGGRGKAVFWSGQNLSQKFLGLCGQGGQGIV
jgi:hypothetical protein